MSIAHIHTRDLPELVADADILVSAAGAPGLIKGAWIKHGAVVIDVGINRVPTEDGRGSRIVGDVCVDEAKARASAITPVPGGVGPMTIACLLENTLRAAISASGSHTSETWATRDRLSQFASPSPHPRQQYVSEY